MFVKHNNRCRSGNSLGQECRFAKLATTFLVFQLCKFNWAQPKRAPGAVEPGDVIFNKFLFWAVAQTADGDNAQTH